MPKDPHAGLESSLRDAGFRGPLLPEEPLAPFTTWRIGGPAELLARPESLEDLALALRWAAEREVPWRALGNGSNLLVRDEGVRGLVLHVRKVLDAVDCNGERIRAGAGAFLPAVANLAASRGLAGLEFAAGIPGTMGGAVVMNAGWHDHEIRRVVESVEVLDESGEVQAVTGEACDFGYRKSVFHERRGVVVGVVLRMEPGDSDELRERLDEYAALRKVNQPTEQPSCGSVFLKPAGDYAGRLVEEAGLKGLTVGKIQVSPKHANFFVNLGGGRAADVLKLVEVVEREVRKRLGVPLTREFETW